VLYAVGKLNSVDVRLLCSCTVCGHISLSSVMTRFHQDRNSRHAHTTDDNDTWPHTVQEHNKRTSTEFTLATV
jgi:hypothetical protein